jgi:hypothetical protein
MRACCRPGEGCNARPHGDACALVQLRRDGGRDAGRALALWRRVEAARGPERARERRFLRRAYARARDRALGEWTPWGRAAA